jgi:hypothetical protein
MSENENVDKQGRPRRRRIRWWMIVLALLIAFLAWNYWPRDPEPIIIGPDTTYVEGPLREDGTVDYVAHINQKYSQGVTPENNAAPLLVKALGSDLLPEEQRDYMLRTLGLTRAEADAPPNFVDWHDRQKVLPARAPATAPADPSAMTPEEIAAAEEQQALDEMDLEDATEAMHEGEVHPDLEPWLDANAEALELIEQATRREKYYIPSVGDHVWALPLPFLPRYRLVGFTFTARAALRQHSGDLAGAWQDVMTTHRLARLIQQAPSLIEQLVAVVIENSATEASTRLAADDRLGADLARQMLADLKQLKPVGRSLESIDSIERLTLLDAIAYLYRGGTFDDLETLGSEPSRRSRPIDIDYNAVLRRANGVYDQMMAEMRKPFYEPRQDNFTPLLSDSYRLNIVLTKIGGRLGRRRRTEAIGDVLIGFLLPSLNRAALLEGKAQCGFALEKLAVALAVYKHDNGQYPDKLDELSPDYLAEIPADPFSGKGLIYYPDELGYVLYSVGLNGRDDGGINERDEDESDIAVGVPFERVWPVEKKQTGAGPGMPYGPGGPRSPIQPGRPGNMMRSIPVPDSAPAISPG